MDRLHNCSYHDPVILRCLRETALQKSRSWLTSRPGTTWRCQRTERTTSPGGRHCRISLVRIVEPIDLTSSGCHLTNGQCTKSQTVKTLLKSSNLSGCHSNHATVIIDHPIPDAQQFSSFSELVKATVRYLHEPANGAAIIIQGGWTQYPEVHSKRWLSRRSPVPCSWKTSPFIQLLNHIGSRIWCVASSDVSWWSTAALLRAGKWCDSPCSPLPKTILWQSCSSDRLTVNWNNLSASSQNWGGNSGSFMAVSP